MWLVRGDAAVALQRSLRPPTVADAHELLLLANIDLFGLTFLRKVSDFIGGRGKRKKKKKRQRKEKSCPPTDHEQRLTRVCFCSR